MKTKHKGLYIALEASLAGAVAMAVAGATAYAVRGQSDLKVEERKYGQNSAYIMDY